LLNKQQKPASKAGFVQMSEIENDAVTESQDASINKP
jgi:hypothetical protein